MGKGIREFKKNINDATREVTAESQPREPEARLTAAELERRRTAPEETERPAPKRLL
jgi:Sec-independent protein translocase protein TatA